MTNRVQGGEIHLPWLFAKRSQMLGFFILKCCMEVTLVQLIAFVECLCSRLQHVSSDPALAFKHKPIDALRYILLTFSRRCSYSA